MFGVAPSTALMLSNRNISMNEKQIDVTKTKCYTCKYGLATLQENTAYMEANFPIHGAELEAEPEILWEDEIQEQPAGPKKITQTQVCSLCYWAPPGFKMDSPIINIATIKECSRYEKKDE